METILKLFSDEAMTEQVRAFAFPRVDVGDSHSIPFYVINESEEWKMEISPVFELETDTEKIEFIDLPEILTPMQKVKIMAKWKPSASIKKELKGWIGLKGRLLIGDD